MTPEARAELETAIRDACERGDARDATAVALRGYGREIYELLAAIHRDETDADEVFSIFSEAVLRGIGAFRWDSSFRTWAYAVARRSSLRYRRDERRRGRRAAALSDAGVSAIAEQIRSETRSFLRTERRSRIEELRRSLPEEDQLLLLLRVDRQLAWNELVDVLHGSEDAPLEDATRAREAARLRKRFQLVKDRLYELGRREGLVRPRDDG